MANMMRKIVYCFGWMSCLILSSNFPIFATKQKTKTPEITFSSNTLDGAVVMTVPKDHFATDISLGIVDVKFDGENLKICELGEGSRSGFKGFDKFYGNGALWRMFWLFCSSLNLRPWMLWDRFSNDTRIANAFSEYEAFGGRFAHDLRALEKDSVFNDYLKNERAADYFSDFNALVIARDNCYRDAQLKNFKKNYPRALILSEALGPFGNDKLLMHSLFDDELLKKYRPKCMVMQKQYYRGMAKCITEQLKCDCYVIKPINSSKGNGVIMVKKADLFKTLRTVLERPESLPDIKDPTYGYWVKDKSKTFLIEEYAPSKLIEFNGAQYDATMRVMYILFCDKGRIGILFLGSYWKLPAKSIHEKCLLTEKHKSSIKADNVGSAMVDLVDYKKVTGILKAALPMAYVKILQDRERCAKV